MNRTTNQSTNQTKNQTTNRTTNRSTNQTADSAAARLDRRIYVKTNEFSARWNVTPRRVNQLCALGLIPGAYKEGKFWKIPADADRPEVLRTPVSDAPEAEKEPLPAPVGVTSFREAVTECFYADKTLLIRDLVDDRSKVTLFTRPRGFGKTLAMDMLRTFFERTEEDTSALFRDRKIWSCGEKYLNLQGRFPVIFLSFKDACQNSIQDLKKSITFTVKEEYLRHIGLLNGENLSVYDKKYFEKIVSGKADPVEFQFSLGKLSSMLRKQYGEKVIVLVDEYDTPLRQGKRCGCFDEIVSTMRVLLSAVLKDNDALEFGVLTGVQGITKDGLFNGLRNLTVNSILDVKYAGFFGLTEADVLKMAEYYGVADRVPEIREWYGGYVFGGKKLFDPRSVIRYFGGACVPKSFEAENGGNEVLGKLLESCGAALFDAAGRLLQGEEIKCVLRADLSGPECCGDVDSALSFLFVSGLLKGSGAADDTGDDRVLTLSIPDREVKGVFEKEILNRCGSLYTGAVLENLEKALRNGDSGLLSEALKAYFMRAVGTADMTAEAPFSLVVPGLLAVVSDHFSVLSDAEPEEGRFAFALRPRNGTKTGYMIELKEGRDLNGKALNGLAKETVQELRTKLYHADLRDWKIDTVESLGIAFCGKKTACEQEKSRIG